LYFSIFFVYAALSALACEMYCSFSLSVTDFHIFPSFFATSVTEYLGCFSTKSSRTSAVQSMYAESGRLGQLGSLGAFTIFI